MSRLVWWAAVWGRALAADDHALEARRDRLRDRLRPLWDERDYLRKAISRTHVDAATPDLRQGARARRAPLIQKLDAVNAAIRPLSDERRMINRILAERAQQLARAA